MPPVQAQLLDYVQEALDDARLKLRKGFEDLLSPFGDPQLDPAANFPRALHRRTLQGYWGELLAGLSAENRGAAGHADWIIPAYLFRFHDTEFQHLEVVNANVREGLAVRADAQAEMRPGRTGNDVVAFRLSADGEITDVLVVEAKCLTRHSVNTAREAFTSLSKGARLPSAVRELIELLSDYDSADAGLWRKALFQLRANLAAAGRNDALSYATGNSPRRAGRTHWLQSVRPASYTAGRRVDVFEYQFADLDALVPSLFR